MCKCNASDPRNLARMNEHWGKEAKRQQVQWMSFCMVSWFVEEFVLSFNDNNIIVFPIFWWGLDNTCRYVGMSRPWSVTELIGLCDHVDSCYPSKHQCPKPMYVFLFLFFFLRKPHVHEKTQWVETRPKWREEKVKKKKKWWKC